MPRSCSLPGDPNRATAIAERFDGGLAQSRRVTEHRALYGYTGTYKGAPVSVQTTGMGTPSLSIVVEELLRLGAQRLIRVGTCGGIGRGLRTGDLVIASAATPFDRRDTGRISMATRMRRRPTRLRARPGARGSSGGGPRRPLLGRAGLHR